jgi:hypothetical protein
MGLETGTYISDLVSTNPVAGDPVSQGDDHLRLVKSTVKATFPNVSGAVNLTHTQLNLLDSKSLAASGYQKLPSGLIIQWGSSTTAGSGTVAVTYPVAFPTGTLKVVVSLQTSSIDLPYFVGTDAGTTTGFNLYACSTSGAAVSVTGKWIALGY